MTALIVNEARLLRSVQHDGVVRCQGLLRDADGRLLLVMDHLRGQTLAERIAQGPLNARELEALAQWLLDALQAIHSQQILHQDIAPDNIILVEDSCAEATLIDFGLARSLAAADDLHVLVDFAGKYAWVSPEQLWLRDGPPDARSDLYSLGLVLAAAACGRRLHMGEDAASARVGLPPLDDVPAEFRMVLAHMVAPDPADRPMSAAAVADALRRRGRGFFPRFF